MKDFDPYLYHAEMKHTAAYYPLGFALELTTNSEAILDAAEESWGAFRQQFSTPALQLKVGVLEGESMECPAAPIFRAQRNLIVSVADHGNFCVSDLVHGFSFAWLTNGAVSNRSYLRYHFLEAAALSHIANRHAAPIHAACVELDGRGVLLCGESGAGKSSLSFACAHAGWNFISDDASFLVNDRTDRQVVGNCHMVRLRPSSVELFQDAMNQPITSRVGGKLSIELLTETIPGIRRATSSNIDFVVFLNRGDGTTQELIPYSKAKARRYMHQSLCGLDELANTQIESVDKLLGAQVLELRYRDLDWAVARLERMAREQKWGHGTPPRHDKELTKTPHG
jgi:hypothetical protein